MRLRECDSVAADEPLVSRLSLGSSRPLPFLRAIRSFAASEARFLRGGERERDLEGRRVRFGGGERERLGEMWWRRLGERERRLRGGERERDLRPVLPLLSLLPSLPRSRDCERSSLLPRRLRGAGDVEDELRRLRLGGGERDGERPGEGDRRRLGGRPFSRRALPGTYVSPLGGFL